MTAVLYADDDTERIFTLFKIRLPPLLAGMALGISISFITSRFEEVLSRNIQVIFFLPFIVYMADAVGTQTQSIYSRDLKTGNARFLVYLVKESALGILLGICFGLASSLAVYLWLHNDILAISVGVSMFLAVASAPIVALITTQMSQLVNEDPAAGGGPIATVIQDMLSIIIYGIVSSLLLL